MTEFPSRATIRGQANITRPTNYCTLMHLGYDNSPHPIDSQGEQLTILVFVCPGGSTSSVSSCAGALEE